ncbi:hypothetical protein CEP53_006669 [Fusarium sp. AF-6]|nr:hypothetical protein CEP53_006669 [Fusarium sp. AF-6]
MATKLDDIALDVDHPGTPNGRASTDGQQTSSAEIQINLKRGFKMRHVNMFAIAGSIGTGLIIGSGQALAAGGPAFAEMAIFAPMNKGFSGYATRFVDPALGFATGWNYFFKYSVLLANNLTATGLINKYWREDINVGVWIAVSSVFVMALNFLPVEKFGETEFVMAIVKIIVLVGLILGRFIISMGGSPSGDRIGFRYWNDPGAFAPYLEEGSLGRFLGFWACIVQAAFMFMGCEVAGITYGEAKNPQRAIPRAVQQTIWRIAVFYIGGVIVLGMTVPYTNELLFCLAIRGCPQAPAIFAKTNRHGVPVYAVLASSLFICLAFLNVSTSSSTVFGYFVSLSTVLGLINWVNIIATYFCFQRGIKAQVVKDVDEEKFDAQGHIPTPIAPAETSSVNSMTKGGGYLRQLQEAASSGSVHSAAAPSQIEDADEAQNASDIPNHVHLDQENELPGQSLSAETPESTSSHTKPTNPLAASSSTYVADGEGWLRWLGESSTWSFSHKTLMLVRDHLHD